MATRTHRKRAGRAFGAAARRRGQSHRPRRLRAQPPPAEDADRKDLPQHGRARTHQVARRRARRKRAARRPSRGHQRRRQDRHPQSVLRPGLPRPADPRRRQGALCRRAGGGGARHRSARRGGGGAADRGRIRGAAGGVRRGRGDDLEGGRARRAQAGGHVPGPQAPQGQARTPTSRSTSICGAATRRRPSPRPIMCSSTPSAASRCCMCRSSRSSPSRS